MTSPVAAAKASRMVGNGVVVVLTKSVNFLMVAQLMFFLSAAAMGDILNLPWRPSNDTMRTSRQAFNFLRAASTRVCTCVLKLASVTFANGFRSGARCA